MLTSFILIGVLSALLFNIFRRPTHFPPGPPMLPIVGSLPFIPKSSQPFAYFKDHFIKRYGKIVGMTVGPFRSVALYDYETIKEVFNRDEFQGRPDTFLMRFRTGGRRAGIVTNEGHDHKVHRKFMMRTLKDLGAGKSKIEHVLIEEANHMCEYLGKEMQGKPVEVNNLFNIIALNMVWNMVSGRRFQIGDPKLTSLVDSLTQAFGSDNFKILLTFPSVRHILPNWSGWTNWKTTVTGIMQWLDDQIKSKADKLADNAGKQSEDDESAPDFIESYLSEMKTNSDFNGEKLRATVMDLFTAGNDTTASTLSWATLFMILNQDVQRKVQKEIDDVLQGSEPTLEDMKRLPYVEATIAEIQRAGNIAPAAVRHSATEDTMIGDYSIPKGTLVTSVLYHVMSDKDYWTDPENFRPERFLTEDGCFKKDERLVPYGIGKRFCPGELMAKSQLFIIFTRLMQKFTFTASPNHPKPTLARVEGGLTSPPMAYFTMALPRD